jgi:hypothetical protein
MEVKVILNERGGKEMKSKRIMEVVFVLGLIFGVIGWAGAQELNLKDYHILVVKDLEVPPGSTAPESAGVQMAEKAVFQIARYSDKYKLFENVVKEGSKSKEIPPGKKVLVIKGTVKEYTRGSVGRRIGRSFIPGGEWTGTSAFAAHYQFVDQASGKVIHETDLRTGSTGNEDTVEYAMDRNGEALAKTILKLKGK